MFNQTIRPRRLRTSDNLRKLVRETRISPESLIWPIFVAEGENIYEEIPSLPGQYHYSPDQLYRMVERAHEHGVSRVILFGLPKDKDEIGSGAWAEDGIVQQGIRKIKELDPEMYVVTDVCMCEYTSHGHCGILDGQEVDNDKTLDYLCRIALSQVEAGADMVAPSDMMDGRVGAIRAALDRAGHINTPIMSYAAKYASAFYGPFRDAAGSAPAFGDRKSYQMDWHNSREAVKEALADVEEGADIVMVKPAMAYGDIIARVKAATNVPVAAYSVSGEYAMVKTCGRLGLGDETALMCEIAAGAFRAGADIYLTYFAKELAAAMAEGRIG